MKENRESDTKKQEKYETQFKKTLYDIGEKMNASDELKKRIDRQLVQAVKEERNMKHFSVKKLVIGVAAACLLVGTVCVAGNGLKTYVSGGSPVPEYTNFADLAKAEEKVGYSIHAVEQFSNGYELKSINVNSSAILNEAGKKEEELKDIYMVYQKDGKEFYFIARELFESENPATIVREGKVPDQTLQVGEVEVVFNRYTYKFVPVGYELTEEDKLNLERDDYEISEGSDEVEIKHNMSVVWLEDGILYLIGGFELPLEAEEMLNMEKDVIECGR